RALRRKAAGTCLAVRPGMKYLVMASLLLAPSLISSPAKACGGLFCDRAPPGPSLNFSNLPVAQTAENVLFAMQRTPSGAMQLEAHIQIFYAGPADRFSWIVPVDADPGKPDVGSNQVFQALDSATRPSFAVNYHTEG